ncbi:ABC transporter ATP-binding protein [Gammaproteobacteria bacterium]|nr:ABC transporter ATP-binding protein [Gammaproteobacteria bacterium]
MVFVSLKNIDKSFQSGTENIDIMSGFSMQVSFGEHLAIMGPSGSGKTTLLNLVAGLDKPDFGEVCVNDQRIDLMNAKDVIRYRRDCLGFIFQDFGLLEGLTAVENILLVCHHQTQIERQEALSILSDLNIENRANTVCRLLSGGEKQRVAIARALILKPKLILADEPTAQLDRIHADQVMGMLTQIQKAYDLTIMTVTHDQKIASYADRVIRIEES